MAEHSADDRIETGSHVDLSFSWEAFVLLLSILSVINLVLAVLPIAETSKQVIYIVDAALTIVFLADFFRRLQVAPSKRGYFFRGGGVLDLIGSIPIPGLRLARLFRIFRAVRVMRRYGLAEIRRQFGETKAQGSILVIVFVAVVVLEFASIFVLGAERGAPDANITTASDALWWGYVTITTVGYGDQYPVTNAGRIVGAILMTIGVGVFSTFAGFLANTFLSPRRAKEAVATVQGRPVSEADLDELRSLVGEQERATSELRSKLAGLGTPPSA
jgi:voltage-gated potassium channel